MFKISQRKWISISLLLLTIILSLVVLFLAPTFTTYIGKEGFKEGLLAKTDLDKLKGIMETYTKTTEEICTKGVNELLNKMASYNLSTSEQVSIQPLLADKSRTAKYKIDQITQMNTTNTQLSSHLASINGQLYTATTVMLNAISALNITDDTTFTALIKQHRTTPSVTDTANTESSYTAIKTYLDNLASLPK
jgi:hypothetical protein